MPKGAFPCVSVGTGFELARLIPGENTGTVEYHNSPSNSAEGTFISVDLHRNKSTKSFQFVPKTQISSGQSKNAECFRILTFNNSFAKFQNKKIYRNLCVRHASYLIINLLASLIVNVSMTN